MDQDLVVGAQDGDQRAFADPIVACHPRLFRLAHGILGNPYLAEDATQQAYLGMWPGAVLGLDVVDVRDGPGNLSGTWIVDGEGAYEGLSAVLHNTVSDTAPLRGFIVSTDQLPPAPEALRAEWMSCGPEDEPATPPATPRRRRRRWRW